MKQFVLMSVFSVIVVMFPGDASAKSVFDMLGAADDIKMASDDFKQVATDSIQKFLDGAQRIGKDLVNQGVNEGRVALVQGGNEIQVAVANARSQFGNEMSNQIQDASETLQPILVELQRWEELVNTLKTTAIDLEDSFAIDLGRIPLSKDYFGVRRVTGVVIVENDKTVHPIRVTGDNFGATIVGQTVNVNASVDGMPLDQPQKVGPHQVQFEIPAKQLAGKFTRDKLGIANLKIVVTRTKTNFGIFHTDTTLEHDVSLVLLPAYVGELTIQTERPTYDWVPSDPQRVTHAISQPTAFAFPELIPESPKGPETGNQKYGPDVVASCGPVTETAWRLLTGEVVLDSDPLIRGGWSSSSWVGSPRGPDLGRFDNEAMQRIGWTPGFWTHDMCPSNEHCTISPNDIKAHAQQTTTEVNTCSFMRMAEKNYANHDSSLIAWIRGAAEHESMWTVTAPVFTYKETGRHSDAPKISPIYASELNNFDIDNQSKSITMLSFKPKNGVPSERPLPESIPGGLFYESKSSIGDNTTRYFYKFEYNKAIFDLD
ncbi:hypothetical protein [Rhodoblastus sp.]|uniref:hypothetical protein n=1 Tax=Rhodoblastus sp. TaxID=1962975 RepID=UPI003F9D8906